LHYIVPPTIAEATNMTKTRPILKPPIKEFPTIIRAALRIKNAAIIAIPTINN
jgi:hypothetical protein